MRVIAAGWSDIGLQRHVNEDSFAIMQEGREAERQGVCFVVCDGLGGAPAGEVASRLATDAFVAAWSSSELSAVDTRQRLQLAVHEANTAVYRALRSSAELTGMGTTLTGLVSHAGWAYVCNVGDSRCYRLRTGVLKQLTEDHTLAADMVRQGLLDPAYAGEVSERNILTRAVGTAARVEADVTWDEMRVGDRYLLCSDGLWGTVPQPDLVTTLAGSTVQDAARRLVDLANEHGGPDNATALVVDVLD
jgi:PPM family protein phosphatase